MVKSVVELSLVMSSLLTVFLFFYWAMKTFRPKEIVIPRPVGYSRRKKVR